MGSTDHQPLVSAIVPTYNCAEYLPRALSSIFSQTYRHIECIVINDGSTDNTLDILQAYKERIRLLRQDKCGAASARNLGLKYARGRLTAFLDADDYWHPTKIEKQVAAFARHPHLALVSCDFENQAGDPSQVLLSENAEHPVSSEQLHIYEDFLTIFRNPYLGTPTVMISTELAIDLGGFDSALPVGEDVDLWLRACHGRSYAHISQSLAYVHSRAGSLTSKIDGYRHNLTVLDRAEQAWPTFANKHHDEFSRLRLSIYRNWVAACLVSRDASKARDLIRESSQYGRFQDRSILLVKSYIQSLLATCGLLRP